MSAAALYCSMICPAHAGAEPEKPAGHGVGFGGAALGAFVGSAALGSGPGDGPLVGAAEGIAAASQRPGTVASSV